MPEIFERLQHLSKSQGNLPALISEYETLSFYDLHELVLRAANLINNLGLKQEDSVGLRFRNPSLYVIFSFALIRQGIAQISFSSEEKPELVNEQSEQTGLRAILSDFTDTSINLECFLTNLNHLRHHPVNQALSPVYSEYPLLLLLGSGTTGKPKFFGITLDELSQEIFDPHSQILKTNPGERILSSTRPHFASARNTYLINICLGLTYILKVSGETSFSQMIDRLGVDHLYLTDNFARNLIQNNETLYQKTSQARFPHLKSIKISGASISKTFVEEIRQKLNPNLYVRYGANETGGVTLANPEDLKKYPNTIGKIMEGWSEIKLINENGDTVKNNEIGYAFLKTKNMRKGYIDDPIESKKCFKEGWFVPNDLLSQNEEGYFFYHGRTDDLIILDSVNIFPLEIETYLNSLQGVKECAVYPLSDDLHGHIPAATVVPELSAGYNITINEVFNHLENQFGWKSPRVVEFRNELPRNPRGKVLKKQLRKEMQQQLEAKKKPN